jgi:hypothetical protein
MGLFSERNIFFGSKSHGLMQENNFFRPLK